MEDVIIKIKGMMCEHCEKMIHDAAVGVKESGKQKPI